MDIEKLKKILIAYHHLDSILSNIDISFIKDIPEGEENFLNVQNKFDKKKGGMDRVDDSDDEQDVPDEPVVQDVHVPAPDESEYLRGSWQRALELANNPGEDRDLIDQGYPPRSEFQETYDLIHNEEDIINPEEHLRFLNSYYPRYHLYAKLKTAINQKHTSCIRKLETIHKEVKNKYFWHLILRYIFTIINALDVEILDIIFCFVISFYLFKFSYTAGDPVHQVYMFYESYDNSLEYIYFKHLTEKPFESFNDEEFDNIKNEYINLAHKWLKTDIISEDLNLSEEAFIDKYFGNYVYLWKGVSAWAAAIASLLFLGSIIIKTEELIDRFNLRNTNVFISLLRKIDFYTEDYYQLYEYYINLKHKNNMLTDFQRENPRSEKYILEMIKFINKTQEAWINSRSIELPDSTLRKIYQIEDIKLQIYHTLKPRSKGIDLIISQLLQYDFIDIEKIDRIQNEEQQNEEIVR